MKKESYKKSKKSNEISEKLRDDDKVTGGFYFSSIKSSKDEIDTSKMDSKALRMILMIQGEILKYINNNS